MHSVEISLYIVFVIFVILMEKKALLNAVVLFMLSNSIFIHY